MSRFRTWLGLASFAGGLAVVPGCDADGVGDPCVPEDEYSDTFSGFALSEVSSESRSFQCQSRLCLVNHFQGRVSCPYGQVAAGGGCTLPGGGEPIRNVVKPQLLERRADDAVYCSCRCAGPEPGARYCECPSGFSCSPVVPDFELGAAQLPGSYCIREGSEYSRVRVGSATCDPMLANCED
jgi:hypothetical protein